MNPPPADRRRAGALFRGVGARPAVLVELILLLLWFLLFARLAAAAGKDFAVATANALALQSAEHAVHLDIELSANTWLAGNPVLAQLAVYVYRLYYVVVAGVLLWVFVRHAGVYRQVRRTMVAMMALVLPVYWAVPMSPPRFALPGAVDIVARYDILDQPSWTSPTHYTAMPSMHVGWSLWCAYAVWFALRGTHRRLALVAWSFPLLMTAVVFTTGNHYVLDVVGSVTLLAVSILAATVWGRLARSRRPVPLSPLPGRTTDRSAAYDSLLRDLLDLVGVPHPADGEWWQDRARKSAGDAVARRAAEAGPVPEEWFEPLLRAAVHEPDPSVNRQLVEPAITAFGRDRVQLALIDYLDSGTAPDMAGAARAWYWAELVVDFEVVGDLSERYHQIALRRFVTETDLDVRRCILPGLPLDPRQYPAELHDLVTEAVRIARTSSDGYLRSRVELQVPDQSQ
ncbi:phosphatase PAP2 family protein [Amycolatopsis sp. NPDC048633]|uniref:phosphatase PAP2 family protein n=1 Tax=Amycolatopsis sp. NPDC048633 TaxID=3157095 RepID=UPI0033F61AF2